MADNVCVVCEFYLDCTGAFSFCGAIKQMAGGRTAGRLAPVCLRLRDYFW